MWWLAAVHDLYSTWWCKYEYSDRVCWSGGGGIQRRWSQLLTAR